MTPSQTCTAAVLRAGQPGLIEITERPIFPPQPNQVTLQVVTTGLCGSDLHYFAHGRNGDFKVRQDLVLGHESSAIITAVGSSISTLSVGQRVAIEAGIYCTLCDFCKSGRYNLCKAMRFCSSASVFPHNDGTLQTRMNHPGFVVHPLPPNCTFEDAALAEPLSVLIHATRRAQLAPGQTTLIFGVGTIGLLACALAKAKGAKRVVAVDINPARLHFAKHEGFADDVFCLSTAPESTPEGEEEPQTLQEKENQIMARAKLNAGRVLDAFDAPTGFDIVYECTGAQSVIQMSVHTAQTGGKVMLIGMGSRNVTLPLSAAACREVDIHGSFRYANTYPEALEMLGSGVLHGEGAAQDEQEQGTKRPDVSKLITHRFSLERAQEAFELMRRGVDEDGRLVLKVMVGSEVRV